MATLFFARVLQTARGGTGHGATHKRLKKNGPDANCKRRAKKSGGEVVGGWVINDREGAYLVSSGARIKSVIFYFTRKELAQGLPFSLQGL